MSDPTYLTAKRTVDDRAINRNVLQTFESALPSSTGKAVEILEVGAGTGTMIARLVEWDMLPESVTYRAVDTDGSALAVARNRVPEWLRNAGYEIETKAERTDLIARNGVKQLEVTFERGDALAIDASVDVLIACAFVDLLSIPDDLNTLFSLLREGGIFYAPVTFDGLTGFVPTHELDDTVTQLYHRHMEVRSEPGTSTAGRDLLEAIQSFDCEVLAVGGSDWVIRPNPGGYPNDEALVIRTLLSMITQAIGELDTPSLDEDEFQEWYSTREEQRGTGSLSYLAHNLDVVITL